MNRKFIRAENWGREADRELKRRDKAVEKATATETRKRERAEAAKWRREIGKEQTRREKVAAVETRKRERKEHLKWAREIGKEEIRRVRRQDEKTAAETKKRERAEFLKWKKEIRQEEERREFQLWKGKKKFLTVRKRLSRVIQHQKNVRSILISRAIRRNTQKWLVKGDGYKDPLIFLKSTAPTVERFINSVNSAGKKVNVVLICKMMKTDPAAEKPRTPSLILGRKRILLLLLLLLRYLNTVLFHNI